jgi:hypothetical protein
VPLASPLRSVVQEASGGMDCRGPQRYEIKHQDLYCISTGFVSQNDSICHLRFPMLALRAKDGKNGKRQGDDGVGEENEEIDEKEHDDRDHGNGKGKERAK